MSSAVSIANVLSIQLNPKNPRAHYKHGQGVKCLETKPIIVTWYMTVHDILLCPTTLAFYLTMGDVPLITGLDIKRYSDTYNLGQRPMLELKRPINNEKRRFYTYIEEDDNGNERLWLDVSPNKLSTIHTLMRISLSAP